MSAVIKMVSSVHQKVNEQFPKSETKEPSRRWGEYDDEFGPLPYSVNTLTLPNVTC